MLAWRSPSGRSFGLRSITILGCRVDDVTLDEATDICLRLIRRGRPATVVTPNAEIVVAAGRDPALQSAINSSELSIPDGAGLLLAGRLLGTPLRAQTAGTDLCYRLAEVCARNGLRLFLLGAAEGVAAAAAAALERMYPGLAIAGVFSGRADPEGDADTRAAIAAVAPVHVVLVAYGAPRQEKWIARNQAMLDIPLAVGVGGAFDFISGRVPRAPGWIRRLGFDWLYRLIRQPWRWRRQLALPIFVWRVLRSAKWRRRSQSARSHIQQHGHDSHRDERGAE